MSVELVTSHSPDLLGPINTLMSQLSSSAPALSQSDLQDLLDQEGVYLFLYRQDEQVLGMLTLATFTIPTGKRGWIEDVVVDEQARGRGAGQALVDAALELAGQLDLATVDLTSRPSREAANRLYVRCGFEPRETNIYRYKV